MITAIGHGGIFITVHFVNRNSGLGLGKRTEIFSASGFHAIPFTGKLLPQSQKIIPSANKPRNACFAAISCY